MVKWLFTMCLTGFFAYGQTLSHSVYFDHDSYNVQAAQLQALNAFTASMGSLDILQVDITGWCDDTGTAAYNMALSEKRAHAVAAYFNNTPQLTAEGKGEIALATTQNPQSARSKNRRVTVVVYLRTEVSQPEAEVIAQNAPVTPKNEEEATEVKEAEYVTYTYKKYGDKLEAGDRILVENLEFERGHTKLTRQGERELKKLLKFLEKNPGLNFEIQGHVCCIYPWEKDALDEDTGLLNLSVSRAKAIYDYLAEKGISAEKMTFQGFGRQYPIKYGDEYANKRVEILIR